jgi:hypothetical protein
LNSALHLLGRRSTTWATPPAQLFINVKYALISKLIDQTVFNNRI